MITWHLSTTNLLISIRQLLPVCNYLTPLKTIIFLNPKAPIENTLNGYSYTCIYIFLKMFHYNKYDGLCQKNKEISENALQWRNEGSGVASPWGAQVENFFGVSVTKKYLYIYLHSKLKIYNKIKNRQFKWKDQSIYGLGIWGPRWLPPATPPAITPLNEGLKVSYSCVTSFMDEDLEKGLKYLAPSNKKRNSWK